MGVERTRHWVEVISYENTQGSVRPAAAIEAWLRDRGIDRMPFTDDEIRVNHVCGKTPDGRPAAWNVIKIQDGALRRLGLNTDPGAELGSQGP